MKNKKNRVVNVIPKRTLLIVTSVILKIKEINIKIIRLVKSDLRRATVWRERSKMT